MEQLTVRPKGSGQPEAGELGENSDTLAIASAFQSGAHSKCGGLHVSLYLCISYVCNGVLCRLLRLRALRPGPHPHACNSWGHAPVSHHRGALDGDQRAALF